MKLSLQFPMVTKSENALRSLPFAVANAPRGKQMGMAIGIANKVKKQREEVTRFLQSQLPRLRRTLPGPAKPRTKAEPVEQLGGRLNFFRVTLIRISAGMLDDDGLAGALKTVRDAVAAWLGCGDGPRDPASWRNGQQKGPPKVYAVRIEIEDDDTDDRHVVRVVGDPIAKLGEVIFGCDRCGLRAAPGPAVEQPRRGGVVQGALGGDGRATAGRRSLPEQHMIIFRPAYYADPLDQRGEGLVLTPTAITAEPPPSTLVLRRTIEGRPYVSATLERTLGHDDEGREIWIYTVPERPSGRAQAAEHRGAAAR